MAEEDTIAAVALKQIAELCFDKYRYSDRTNRRCADELLAHWVGFLALPEKNLQILRQYLRYLKKLIEAEDNQNG